jgi:hypothetical protein
MSDFSATQADHGAGVDGSGLLDVLFTLECGLLGLIQRLWCHYHSGSAGAKCSIKRTVVPIFVQHHDCGLAAEAMIRVRLAVLLAAQAPSKPAPVFAGRYSAGH